MEQHVAPILEEIIRETERFDSAYDRRIRALATKALTIIATLKKDALAAAAPAGEERQRP